MEEDSDYLPEALPPGYRLQIYRIANILGQGGFGITYRAEDTKHGGFVALKEFMPAQLARREGDLIKPHTTRTRAAFESYRAKFLEEATALLHFRHLDNIVHIQAFFQANGTAYLVMDYIDGLNLTEHLKGFGRPPTEEEVKSILISLTDDISEVHASGYLHRDIKPQNILVRADGSPVLIDFGAARQAAGYDNNTKTLTTFISEGYTPPEQYSSHGDQGPWTDIYGLGAVAYRMVTGIKPPAAPSRMLGRTDSCVPAVQMAAGRYSRSFLAAIDWALERFAENRPQNLAAWKEALINGPPDRDESPAKIEISPDAPTQIGSGATGASFDDHKTMVGPPCDEAEQKNGQKPETDEERETRKALRREAQLNAARIARERTEREAKTRAELKAAAEAEWQAKRETLERADLNKKGKNTGFLAIVAAAIVLVSVWTLWDQADEPAQQPLAPAVPMLSLPQIAIPTPVAQLPAALPPITPKAEPLGQPQTQTAPSATPAQVTPPSPEPPRPEDVVKAHDPVAALPAQTDTTTPGREFRDCAKCPEMVVISAGSFMMGSPETEAGREANEGPRHKVTLSQAFAIGKYAVTFDEWMACVADGGCKKYKPDDNGWGRGKRPVINVSWNDAQGYVQWLNKKLAATRDPSKDDNNVYRLPSEAEWEYSAQNEADPRKNANCNGCNGYENNKRTALVGSYEKNKLGLYDMLGNVWQWTQDCWVDTYREAPANGTAVTIKSCDKRTFRGGSWDSRPEGVRATARGRLAANLRDDRVGFRVLKGLPQ